MVKKIEKIAVAACKLHLLKNERCKDTVRWRIANIDEVSKELYETEGLEEVRVCLDVKSMKSYITIRVKERDIPVLMETTDSVKLSTLIKEKCFVAFKERYRAQLTIHDAELDDEILKALFQNMCIGGGKVVNVYDLFYITDEDCSDSRYQSLTINFGNYIDVSSQMRLQQFTIPEAEFTGWIRVDSSEHSYSYLRDSIFFDDLEKLLSMPKIIACPSPLIEAYRAVSRTEDTAWIEMTESETEQILFFEEIKPYITIYRGGDDNSANFAVKVKVEILTMFNAHS